jgi:hypothetical protein
MMSLDELRQNLENSGGVGLVGFEDEGGLAHILFSAHQVIAVIKGGRHLARHEADRVVEEMIRACHTNPEKVVWVPFIPYRPPIHLMYSISLPES